MALRCTVFGHRWGEADVEREREEEGSEVVVTVREVRTCGRCGAEDVLGESMEVTAIDQPDPEPAAGEREPAGDARGDDELSGHDGEPDDAVILDDEGGDDTQRGPREWPERPEHEREDDGPGEPTPWPETAREDEDTGLTEERFVGAEEAAPAPDPMGPAGGRDEGAEIIDADATGDGDGDATGDDGPDGAGGPDLVDSSDAVDGSDVEEGAAGGPADPHGETADADADRGATGASADPTERTDAPGGGADATSDAGPDDDAVADAGPDDADSDGGPDAGGGGGDAAGTGAADGAPDEPAAMGPDATRRPDDDAEVLETTEPTEQSRVTASEPVDPETAAGPDRTPGGPGDTGPGEGAAADAGGRPREGADPPPGPDGGDDRGPAPEHVEFYCPECGYVDDSEWPSRRAGDVCPDCQRSYLAERET